MHVAPGILAAALFALAGVACSGSSTTRPVASGATAHRADSLDDLAREYEVLMRDHGLAEWHEYTGEGDVAEGALDRLQAQERALFERARPLAEAVLARPDASETERRTAQLWRDGALGLALIGDPEVSRLAHRLEAVLDAHVFERNGQRLTRSDLRHLAVSADPQERRAALDLDAALHREVADIARALLRRRAAVARERGIGPYADALLRLRGIEPARWDALARSLESGTRARYQTLVTEGARAKSLAAVTPADAQYVLASDLDWANSHFAAEGAVDFARRALAGLGLDLDHPPVRIVVREFSFGGQTLSIHVPDDVRTVLRPQAGPRFYGTLLHELGHALQGTRTNVTQPLFKGYEWVPGLTSPGFDEGVAEVFGLLLRHEDFLALYTDLNASDRARLVADMHRNALVSVRSTLASVAFERAALDDPDQDLDALQRRFDREIRLLTVPDDSPPTWAGTPFLATYPMYTQSYAIAAMVAAQVHTSLRQRLGDRWLTRDAGRILTDALLTAGEGVPWQQRLRAATERDLSADDLVAMLLSATP